ncbi:MAG TPA: serine/threonine protein kinase [Polyangiaceae bacterium]|nr:serine/threonine protein kinase [Polyangiaceae bacterium]
MSAPRWTVRACVVALSFAALACGRPFKVTTPPGFLEVHDEGTPFAYRAIAPEGVVAGVRVIDLDDDDGGGLAFWTHAVIVRMREIDGYALLGESDVKSADGTPGRELRFGHDQGDKPYLYTVRIYLAQSRLFLVETGGGKGDVARYQASLDWMEKTVRVRCGGFLAPVLSSHTCNRW